MASKESEERPHLRVYVRRIATFMNVMMTVKSNWKDMPIYTAVS
jgi:hypothetical protein